MSMWDEPDYGMREPGCGTFLFELIVVLVLGILCGLIFF